MEPGDEANPDDLLFAQNMSLADSMRQDGESIEDAIVEGEDPSEEAKVRDKFVPLYREIAMMTNSQKIRFATIGTPEAILILINDPSPLVSRAAAQSPQMNEAVVATSPVRCSPPSARSPSYSGASRRSATS
jgi:hypothetical protein